MGGTMKPVAVAAGEGRRLHILGDNVTCKLDGQATGGAFAVFEVIVPPDGGPPPHIHHREDETIFIVEGEIEFWVDGRTFAAKAGTWVFAPRGVPHRFHNRGIHEAKMMIMATPAGLERFFEEMSREVPTMPPDMEKVIALCAKQGIEILPPKA
ncbi:MAG: quercetin 2,3-dioxygenase [Phycisphaerales bacterium]